MFNGIIKHTGKISKVLNRGKDYTIDIYSSLRLSKNEIGSSISCSGVCLTLTSFKKKNSKFFVSKETLDRSNFKFIKKNDIINLEKSLIYGDRVSGHFVQGHVDTTCKIIKIDFVGKSWEVEISLPQSFKKYLVSKGSIAINGVSLTISKLLKKSFQISVIPHTLKSTNLIYLKENSIVNVEFDILSKYINNKKNG